ncbi:uncharacterized protein LOC143863609 isoform X3 [Tasmannia lanceolata]|uniref:uncharacterized protein LOC143863609 isoform X3 n=1 Tax=Tasmannia lanceolata TaxID=3420 RepID=UPI004062C9EB
MITVGVKSPIILLSFSNLQGITKFRNPPPLSSSRSFTIKGPGRKDALGFVGFVPQAAISGRADGSNYDPELRLVLELATDSELYELENILFSPSYFSPLLKSVSNRPDVDYIMHGEEFGGREDFIEHLESRFLFLAADARSILSEEAGDIPFLLDDGKFSNSHGTLEHGLAQWKVHALAVLKVGAEEFHSIILKGGGVLTLAKIYQLLARRLSGKMLLEAANYQIKNEVIKKGGQLAAINLESRAALLVARQDVGNISGRCCHTNDRHRLCQNIASDLCICPDPSYSDIRMGIRQGLTRQVFLRCCIIFFSKHEPRSFLLAEGEEFFCRMFMCSSYLTKSIGKC